MSLTPIERPAVAVTCVADVQAALSESPVWDAEGNRLLWVDILGRRLSSMSFTDGEIRHWDLPQVIGSMALCSDGGLVLALADGVYGFDPTNGARTLICAPERDCPTNRLNDGKAGPDGAFWVGSMDDRPVKEPVGALYRIAPDGTATRMIEGIKVSNGLAWSADAKTLYHSDSRGPWIDRWDFHPTTGAISNRRRIVTLTESDGRPDGGATDIEGGYWSCGVSAGCLNRFAPDGRLLARYDLPIPAPTMCAFGGADMRTLFITSARQGLLAEALAAAPQSGSIFAMRADVAGVPVHRLAWRGGTKRGMA